MDDAEPERAGTRGARSLRPCTTLLDVNAPVAEALRRLEGLDDEDVVVLRREEGLVVFWYAGPAGMIRDAIADGSGGPVLRDALGLHEHESCPTRDVADVADADDAPDDLPVVVLDGDEPVGVLIAIRDSARGDSPCDDEYYLTGPGAVIGDAGEGTDAAPDPERTGVGMPPPPTRMPSPSPPRGGAGPHGGGIPSHPSAVDRPASVPRTSSGGTGLGWLWPFNRSGRDHASEDVEMEEASPPPTVPPFSAHPVLRAPEWVEFDERFELEVALAKEAQPGTSGGPIRVELPDTVRTFDLDVLVQCDGFEVSGGARARMHVDRSRVNEALVTFRLVPVPGVADLGAHLDPERVVSMRSLVVTFFHRGVLCGVAERRLVVGPKSDDVLREPVHHGRRMVGTGDDDARVTRIDVREDALAPDLTVVITRPGGNAASGALTFSCTSPHAVDLAEPETIDLGDDTATFARTIVERVVESDRSILLDGELQGLGEEIADRLPPGFWHAVRAVDAIVRARGGDPMTLLIDTAEAHVPWELARVDPPLDPAAPPFLAAQICVGRWIVSQPVPPHPPADRIDVERMTVVTGHYDPLGSSHARLAHAEEESRVLSARWAAEPLRANAIDVVSLLRLQDGRPGCEVLHLACHGEADPTRPLDTAIILEDGRPLRDSQFRATRLGAMHRPFAFLNACEVGSASLMLRAASGFAASMVRGEFRGFVAPLWKVRDEIALAYSTAFYESTLAGGSSVGEAMRELRERYDGDADEPDATWLAYVFYGHPALRLARGAGSSAGDSVEPGVDEP